MFVKRNPNTRVSLKTLDHKKLEYPVLKDARAIRIELEELAGTVTRGED